MSRTSNSITYALVALAAVLVLGLIAQVLIETLQQRTSDVNPVIAALAGTAIAALYGHGNFLAQGTTNADQRDAFLSVLGALSSTPNAPIGKPTSSVVTPIPMQAGAPKND